MSYRDLTLQDAEELVVGRCLVDEDALIEAVWTLPIDCFRGAGGADLSKVFYALVGMHQRGAFDGATNQDVLAEALIEHDAARKDSYMDEVKGGWYTYLENLWSPWTASRPWFSGLLKAIVEEYTVRDEVRASMQRLFELPLAADPGLIDEVLVRIREVVAQRRDERRRRIPQEARPSSSAIDWESILSNVPV